ncbi:MAG: RNA polymerase sigma factor [Vicinamibacterales bacterium]
MTATLTWMSTDSGTSKSGEDVPVASESTAADLELVRLALAGDQQAFGQLVDQNRRAVFRAAYAALGSREEAEDVAQETFVAVFQRLHSFRGESSFRTWLLSIAWRKALTRRRKLTRWFRPAVVRERADESVDPIERARSPEPSQHDGLAGEELHRTLKRLIPTLPRKLRDALLLAGSGDHSYEQIARMLDVPVGTVKWRVFEARRLLKRKLIAAGYAHD